MHSRKKTFKTLALAFVGINVITACFGLVTNAAAAQLGYEDTVDTVYLVKADAKSAPLAALGSKANTGCHAMLEKGSPAPQDTTISMESAAELVAQEIGRIYGTDLAGKTIQMHYEPVSEWWPRALWFGSYDAQDGSRSHASVDAITGAAQTVGKDKVPDTPMPEKEPIRSSHTEYEALAKEAARTYCGLSGALQAQFSHYTYDKTRRHWGEAIRVKDENGKKANLTFSVEDKSLQYIQYNDSVARTVYLEKKQAKENPDRNYHKVLE